MKQDQAKKVIAIGRADWEVKYDDVPLVSLEVSQLQEIMQEDFPPIQELYEYLAEKYPGLAYSVNISGTCRLYRSYLVERTQGS